MSTIRTFMTKDEQRRLVVIDDGYRIKARYFDHNELTPYTVAQAELEDEGLETIMEYKHSLATPALVYDVVAALMPDDTTLQAAALQAADDCLSFHPSDPLTPPTLRYWAQLASGHAAQGGKTYSAALVASVMAKADELERELRLANEKREREARRRAEDESLVLRAQRQAEGVTGAMANERAQVMDAERTEREARERLHRAVDELLIEHPGLLEVARQMLASSTKLGQRLG